MGDNELVAACLQGQGEEFRKIVDCYKGPVMALAMNILGNRQDAEDACQETFIRSTGIWDYSIRKRASGIGFSPFFTGAVWTS